MEYNKVRMSAKELCARVIFLLVENSPYNFCETQYLAKVLKFYAQYPRGFVIPRRDQFIRGIHFMIRLLVWFSFMSQVVANPLTPEMIRAESEHKPVSVLQQRFFLKAFRPEIGILAGTYMNESYTSTNLYGFRGTLYINEWIGFEGQWYKTLVTDSADRKALNTLIFRDRDNPEKLVSPDPEVNPIYGGTDLYASYAPFYGKLNFMDLAIIYLDLYLSAGMSKVDTEQGSKAAPSIGIGQRFFFHKDWSVRVDFRNRMYTETRSGQSSTKHAASVDFALSYLFF
jgi:outer membrane beta-barrel protein